MQELEKLTGSLLDDRYRLSEVIGAGGSAVVFLAEDLLFRRRVALKMLRTSPAPQEGKPGDAVAELEAAHLNRAAFRREGIAASMLAHSNIVTVYDIAPEAENPYIVMEYIEGESLADLCEREGVLSLQKILFVTHGVLLALEEAHENGIIHRDIKPENILLSQSGEVKVTDFGIAQIASRADRLSGNRVLGTADTVSPEQASGKCVDARSDLYSLGTVLYRMATGYFPFESDDPDTVAYLHVSEPPRYPSTLNPDIPTGLEQIILTCLEKRPENRFSSAAAMLRAVEELEADPNRVFRRFHKEKRPPKPLTGATRRSGFLPLLCGFLVASLLVGMLFLFLPKDGRPQVTVWEVPSYVGTRVSRNEDFALDSRIEICFVYDTESALPAGTVVAQSLAAGTLLKLDGEEDRVTLTLTLSAPPASE